MTQASSYSATLDYLKAVAKVGSTDGALVGPEMRKMPVSDDVIPSGHIRADGLLIHDMYLVQVKTPAESKRAWDYEKLVKVIPGDQADRKSVVEGKSVSVRVDLGGRRIIKKKKTKPL